MEEWIETLLNTHVIQRTTLVLSITKYTHLAKRVAAEKRQVARTWARCVSSTNRTWKSYLSFDWVNIIHLQRAVIGWKLNV
jgi:hypothetical protein